MTGQAVADAGRSDSGLRILIVDDDVELCAMIRKIFFRKDIRLDMAHDSRLGLNRCLQERYSLVLLDVMMPGLDGLEMLRLLRRDSDVPVIMLTARGTSDDRIVGLDAGADDYLAKPFSPEELLARIRAVLRRVAAAPGRSETLVVNGLEVFPSARQVRLDGVELELTSYEFDILLYLVRLAGRIVSRDELTAAIYQRRANPTDRALDMHISHLRKKLGHAGGLVRTVRGSGFLVPLLNEEDQPATMEGRPA